MINISKDLLRMKPSKKALAREIDRLNAAISKQHVFQEQAEKSMQLSEITAKGWENIASQYKKLVEKYDVEALAEARRLAVFQHFSSGAPVSLMGQYVSWVATGQWPAPDIEEMGEGEGVGPGPEVADCDHTESGITMVAVEGEAYRQSMMANYQNGFIAGREEGLGVHLPNTGGYAHGWLRGWNELLDEIQARLEAEDQQLSITSLELLRKTFNRSEAM